MKARIKEDVRLREDSFGGICYVPSRDDFFAATAGVFSVLSSLEKGRWQDVHPEQTETFRRLASLGVCETTDPVYPETAYSGPSFLGKFLEIPAVAEPLVLNCFSTAHCPLSCVYCHADDLMKKFRTDEDDRDLENVVATARMVPAMVAVITGGDPLTRPGRARYLIERLAGQKALVLDTSGVGDIENLIPLLVQYGVHVRVSLDAISRVNDAIRPINRDYVPSTSSSRSGAERTIEACLGARIPVTVQTVISARNENETEWLDLRDWLVARGVRNWVLHVAVKGGSARRIESEKNRRQRGKGILPSPTVYRKLAALVEDTTASGLPLDIRCTDTDTTPNSVLLVGSRGDLFTEGYAHNGKVQLYAAGAGRPDLVRSSWFHLDRFGHARRYLNWHPWLAGGRDLADLCVDIPVPAGTEPGPGSIIESESKYQVTNARLLDDLLRRNEFRPAKQTLQRDEYFDTPSRALASLDFVVRLRIDESKTLIGLKGPRFYSERGEYSRVEIELETESASEVRRELTGRGLVMTWFFEKRRTEYRSRGSTVAVVIDEIPEAGQFAEIEGELEEARQLRQLLSAGLGRQETRNYRDVFIAFKEEQGIEGTQIEGASFGV